MTTRGAKEDMMHLIAELIEEVLNAPEDEKVIAQMCIRDRPYVKVGLILFLMSSRKNLRQISLLPNLFRIFAF